MTFNVAIDARAAAEVRAGRGRYVRELLTALQRLPEAADVRFELWARQSWGTLDQRFRWRLVALPDPAWHLTVALRAGGDAFLSTNSYLTAWATRIPTAITVYDLVAFIPGVADAAQGRAARIERATIRPALRRASALACISDATRRDLETRFPVARGKATTIPLAASSPQRAIAPVLDRASLGLDRRPYVLAVGTLEPRKNIMRLLRAWTLLPQEVRAGHVLALVGPRGWDDDAIMRKARDVGALLLGHVDEEQLQALYSGCAAFAYPSLYEGFGLPVLEAMAAGAPVLTSNVSSLPEIAGNAALLVDPWDTTAIAAGLMRLLDPAGPAAELRERGRQRARTFSWDRTASETLALLRAISMR